MDSVELEHSEAHTAETCSEHVESLDSPDADDFYGEPPVPPRVGDQYQVEIPPLKTELDSFQLRPSLKTGDMLDVDHDTRVGLAVPIMLVQHAGNHMKYEQEESPVNNVGTQESGTADSRNNRVSSIDVSRSIGSGYQPKSSQGLACGVEFVSDRSCHGKERAGLETEECTDSGCQIDMNTLSLQLKQAADYMSLDSPAKPWSEAEEQSFLLGLYIFGKNLVQVKNFIECKKMGDILSYYYGKFYKSDAHRRWSECRKVRSRKCIHGHRIFTAWRQQEFLSRILPTISKDVQDTLQEATKTFNEDRASLEEFIFALKTAVGIQTLVEAVGIGKGKHDLTGIVSDPAKTNQAPLRPEIPIGKACSVLTTDDIIKFLTGDFRLSKARANDLFWEAVWPRLLARGWHSEQPKHLGFLGSKNGLVFLIPGVKKYSRRRLVKGDHYYDCVRDVLNKVAMDPRLIELDAERESDLDTRSEGQHRCYLKPKLCKSELTMFTVVDTSLVKGEAPFKVIELRVLPGSAAATFNPSALSAETDSGSSEESQDNNKARSDDKKPEDNSVEMKVEVNGHVPDDGMGNKKPVREYKRQFSRRIKPSAPNHLAEPSKQRRLNSCGKEGSKGQKGEEEAECELDSYKSSHIIDPSPERSSECALTGNSNGGTAMSEEKPEPRAMIDLNLPVELPFEAAELFWMDAGGGFHEPRYEEPNPQQRNGNHQSSTSSNRRQSTRNRPPTTKALEALAWGFLGTKKGRGTKSFPKRPSRRARRIVEAPMDVGRGEWYGGSNENPESMFSNSHLQPERKGTRELSVPLHALRPEINRY